MKLLIEIPEKIFEQAKTSPNYQPTYQFQRIWKAIIEGQPLPPNIMILDKDKLERDTEWDDFYDGFMSYSRLALEAAEIKELTE